MMIEGMATVRTALVLAAFAACGRTTRSTGDVRDSLITLATIEAAAALEANADEDRRLAELGHFTIADDPAPPLRAEVLAHVRGWPIERRRRALAFLRAHPEYATLYHALVVESLGPPPAFARRERAPATAANAPALAADRDELAALLREAWTEGHVELLARTLAPRWSELQFTPHAIADHRHAVLTYLGFDGTLPRYDALYDPLLAAMTGYGTQPADDELLLLVGSSRTEEDRSLVLIHEFTHLPLSRILDRPAVRAALDRAACADAKIGDRYGYGGFTSYASEALVRAISYRVAGMPPRNTGFAFEAFFGDQLVAYEQRGDHDFAAFAPTMLLELARRECSP